LEAEESVLGSILKDQEVLPIVLEILAPSDFYRQANGEIYEVITDLYNNHEPVDLITVTNKLQTENKLDLIGGAAYIAKLTNSIPTTAYTEQYAKIVKDKSLIRQVISKANLILQTAHQNDFETAEELINKAESEMFNISLKSTKGSLIHAKDIVFTHIDDIYRRKSLNGITGLATTIGKLDLWTTGLQKGDLIIVAARPSMGKTAFAIQVGKDSAIKYGTSVALFSLEMSKEQVIERLLINEARVDGQLVRVGRISEEDSVKLAQASARISKAKIFIDDTGSITVPEIRTKCRKIKSEKGLDLVIIDYIQLMNGTGKNENRQREITDISRSLKLMAKELQVPVIAISQLSRAVEARNDKKPLMSDLRESGAIEQDADLIMFLYRDEYYNEKTEKRGIAELILAKQRNGPVGTIQLAFLKQYTMFTNLGPESMGNVVKGGWPG
jgi:replicative DNA helicase